jgi:ferredoxin
MAELIAEIDRSACAGHGRCYDLAPEVFEPDDEGFPLVVAPVVPASAVPSAEDAERNCPERAVSLRPAGA